LPARKTSHLKAEIWQLTWPNMLSNLSVPLLGLADITMMGHLGSPVFIGAVALGSIPFNFIYSGLAFLRMGTSGMTAQHYGAGNLQACALMLQRALIAGGVLALLLLAMKGFIATTGFGLLEGSAETIGLAKSYFLIRIWAAPAVLLQFGFHGWFIGMQDARSPMFVAISENILNILFNFMMVFGFGLLSDGVAWGTVMARYAGLMLCVFFYVRKYVGLTALFNLRDAMEIRALKHFFGINGNLFVRTILLMMVLTLFTAFSSRMGDDMLAANSLLLQFFFFFSYLIDGYAYAAEALTGKYTGAGKAEALRIIIRHLFVMGGLWSLGFTLVYLAGGRFILGLLTSDGSIVSLAGDYLGYIIILPVVSYAAFLWDGIYIGATATRTLRNIMMAASCVFLALISALEASANHGLWISLLAFLFIRGAGLTWYADKAIFNGIRGYKKRKHDNAQSQADMQ
jgi:MATE family multidrug resistance protein